MLKKIVLIGIAIFLVVGGLGLIWVATLDIPDFGSFDERLITQSTKIYDRTGKILLYNVHDEVRRHLVSMEEISRHIKNATVAIEDDEFYSHHGIKPFAILRAVFANLRAGGYAQGGSTITQQLIKNTLLTKEKKISRKIKEAVLSLKLEKVMEKDQILHLYLNETPYGGNIYGVEEAAQAFFGKNAKDVTLAEAAYIAAVPKAPTFYSPYGQNKAKLEERHKLVLTRMRELGFITTEEETAAKAETVAFLPPQDRGIKAPHFSLWVRDYLEEKYGPEVVRNRGLKVTTSLNWDWQKKAEEIVARIAPSNESNFNAKNTGLVAIDPKTGEILVMVGSRDYFEVANDGNFNTTLSHRQPGSSFKPFVYATAFNKGYTPETVVFDLETQFDTNCADGGNCYKPQNYDNLFRGPMTLRNALAQSINIPAIKTLYLAGLRESLKTAKDMGIKSLGDDPNLYGLTLVLGGGEVSLLELTNAYGAFAADGLRAPYISILKVEDSEGKILEEATPHTVRALPENTARLISDILSDNTARTPLFGENNLLNFPGRDVAAKTGTTNDYRDAWIVGYTPSVAVGAWAGNNDNTPMEKKVAGLIIAPLWHDFMAAILPDMPAENFIEPLPTSTDIPPVMRGYWQGGESYFVDKISGKLATDYTPPELREEKVLTSVHSILYWISKDDPFGGKPVRPERDPQFELWEAPVRLWAISKGFLDQTKSNIPTEEDDVHSPEFAPEVTIEEPDASDTYNPDDEVRVKISADGKYPLAEATFFLNNNYLGSSNHAPFTFRFKPEEVENLEERNELKVIVYDEMRNRGEETVILKVDL